MHIYTVNIDIRFDVLLYIILCAFCKRTSAGPAADFPSVKQKLLFLIAFNSRIPFENYYSLWCLKPTHNNHQRFSSLPIVIARFERFSSENINLPTQFTVVYITRDLDVQNIENEPRAFHRNNNSDKFYWPVLVRANKHFCDENGKRK